jgi:hypothetical protein
MTSHSSQGETADRVLIHVDTELGAKDLSTPAWPMSRSPVDAMTRRFIRIMHRHWDMNSAAIFPTRQRSNKNHWRTR